MRFTGVLFLIEALLATYVASPLALEGQKTVPPPTSRVPPPPSTSPVPPPPTPSGDAKAAALQPNVVKITATLKQGGAPNLGFGFIVGRQGGSLVIVTADHVVRGDDPDAEDNHPLVTFFESQGSSVRGELQTVHSARDRGDLAVILAPRPEFVSYLTDSIAAEPVARGHRVWLVGRAGSWNIPPQPGVVARIDPLTGRIQVDGLPARQGSSGGPLISADGIVGMIVADIELNTEATPIRPIMEQVRDDWHYTWQLTSRQPRSSVSPPPRATPSPEHEQAAIQERGRASFSIEICNNTGRDTTVSLSKPQPESANWDDDPDYVQRGIIPAHALWGQYTIFDRQCRSLDRWEPGKVFYTYEAQIYSGGEFSHVMAHGSQQVSQPESTLLLSNPRESPGGPPSPIPGSHDIIRN